MRILWEGPQSQTHSLAYVNRQQCSQLMNFDDVELTIIPSEYPVKYGDDIKSPEKLIQAFYGSRDNVDYWIRQEWPPNFTPPPSGRWVLFQHWEYGSIPKQWLPHILYEIDEVWVSSEYTKRMYVRSGVPDHKIFVFPLGIDPDLYRPSGNKYPLSTNKSYKFLFVGGTIWRKGIDSLVNAYMSAFTKDDDVCLVIKDMGTNSFYQGINQKDSILELVRNKDLPEIVYMDEELTSSQLADLYRSCDCLVLPSRGEGFGLPVLEAMACGLPVVVPDKGPFVEFCSSDAAFFIPSRIVSPEGLVLGPEMDLVDKPQMVEVDQQQLAKTMRALYHDPDTGRSRGMLASRRVHREYSWTRVANIVHDHIKNQPQGIPTRFRKFSWVNEGNMAYTKGDWHIAAFCLKKAVSHGENSPELLYKLGISLTMVRRHGEAITYLERAKESLNSSDLLGMHTIYKYLGVNKWNLLQFSTAKQYFLKAQSCFYDPNVDDMMKSIDSQIESYRTSLSHPSTVSPEKLYHEVSHAFEGTSSVIQNMRKRWVGLFQPSERVLEIGCGEGIFLELLKERGIESEGVDIDPEKVSSGQKRGLTIHCGRAEEFLRGKQQTFDGIMMSHIIEHLPANVLIELLTECYSALKPGGRLIIISPNISNPAVQANFWLDITHVRPYPHQLMIKVLESMGLMIAETGTEGPLQDYFIVAKKKAIGLIWESPLLNTSGYASGSRNMLEALRPYPYAINVVLRENDSQPALHHSATVDYISSLQNHQVVMPVVHIQNVPGWALTPPKAPISIARTMFETDRIPEDWVHRCNQFLEIWVPSSFNVETFKRGGVDPKKLFVVPETLDFESYCAEDPDRNFLGIGLRKFVFLSVGVWGINKGSGWGIRKGWDILLRAYVEEFTPKDDVSLLLKVSCDGNSNVQQDVENFLRSIGRTLEDSPHITIISSRSLSEVDMKKIYSNASAFVLPTRGEGWGRPFMEAMAMEIPVIGTAWGGHMEFMNDDNSYLIEIDGLKKVSDYIPFESVVGHYWAEPSIRSTRLRMREVFENYSSAKARAKLARKEIESRFSRAVVSKLIHKRICTLMEQYL